MTKYIIGEIFSSDGATLYKNPSDQTMARTAFLSSSPLFTYYKKRYKKQKIILNIQNMEDWHFGRKKGANFLNPILVPVDLF